MHGAGYSGSNGKCCSTTKMNASDRLRIGNNHVYCAMVRLVSIRCVHMAYSLQVSSPSGSTVVCAILTCIRPLVAHYTLVSGRNLFLASPIVRFHSLVYYSPILMRHLVGNTGFWPALYVSSMLPAHSTRYLTYALSCRACVNI